MCRACGAIVAAGESTCGVCGASTNPQTTLQRRPMAQDREAMRFARAVLERPHKFTIIFLIINLFVFLLMWESSGMTTQVLFSGFDFPVLTAYGAKLNSLIASPNRQWWRLITPMFLHVNLLHLMVNMYSLWILGPYVEKLYGSAKFVVFWVVTGFVGVLASYLTVRPDLATSGIGRFLFKLNDVPSAGASGALFGLIGVLFVFGIKFRHELPEGFKRAFGTGLLPTILINLFIGYLGRGFIDNAAHLGGLVSGAALALVVQYRRPGDSQRSEVVWRVLQVAALGVVAFSFIKVAQNFSSPPPPPPPPPPQEAFFGFVNVMNQSHETIAAVLVDKDVANVDSTVQALQGVVSVDSVSDELRHRLIGLLQQAKAQLSAPLPEADAQKPRQLDKQLNDEFVKWSNDYNAWLQPALKRFNQ